MQQSIEGGWAARDSESGLELSLQAVATSSETLAKEIGVRYLGIY